MVDDADFELIAQHRWFPDFVRSDQKYRARSCLGKGLKSAILMHRFILNAQPGQIVDHVNMNPLDNTRANLRVVNRSQNNMNRNRPLTNTSGVKGVSYSKKNKCWCATIKAYGIWRWLGYFDSLEEASRAYDQASLQYHGQHGRLNDLDSASLL